MLKEVFVMAQDDFFTLIFGANIEGKKLTEVLLNFPFDELFEIDLHADTMRSLYHYQDKYAVFMMDGAFSTVSNFASEHIVHPEDQHIHRSLIDINTLEERAQQSLVPGVLTAEIRLLLADAHYQWTRYILITGEQNGVPAGKWYLYIMNIQDHKFREIGSQMESRKIYADSVTGFYKSTDFFKIVAQQLNQDDYCCIALDIDRFGLFNTLFGKKKGDALLSVFASTLRRCAQERDGIVSHLGMDDFVLFVKYDSAWIRKLYDRLRVTLSSYANSVGFTPILGVYRLQPGETANMDMYNRALIALQEAKVLKTNRIVEFNHSAHRTELEEYSVLAQVQKAINEGRVEFFLQPQCHIGTGQIVGAEALVRMRDEAGNLVPPFKFIPVMEKHGCIADLDKHVWRFVCRWLRELLDQDILPVPVSLNISQMDILTMDVPTYLSSLIQEFNIPASLLKIEITESFYAESTDVVDRFVTELKQRGFTTMMDDFGSGYSSLNMLEALNVDVLKLDMAFMKQGSIHSRRSVTIIESIINMAKMMRLPVVVEGVETQEQINFLKSMGCGYAQGYHFFRPMPRAEFEALLSTPNAVDYSGILGVSNEQYHVREFLDENTFTDTLLNNILGPVGIYTYDGTNLTINRFNQQFFQTIGDIKMESRRSGIHQYVVAEDRPKLTKALMDAVRNPATGGSCEIRFYKSDGGVFWFHMNLYYLRNEGENKIFVGQIKDVTEMREQCNQLFEVLWHHSRLCMRINLEQDSIQYIPEEVSLGQPDLPSMALSLSMQQTIESHIPDPDEQRRFMEFFHPDRLRSLHRQGVYHENVVLNFRLDEEPQPIAFDTYYIRYSQEQDLYVYVFIKEQ